MSRRCARGARWGHAVALAVACAVGTSGRGYASEENDFLPDNSGWNGTSELVAVARGLQLQLTAPQRLVWDDLADDANVVLLWIHPRGDLPTTQLLRFLNRGGRLVVADDYGGAATLLARFGIRRFDGDELRAARYHADNPKLPIALPQGVRHPLLEGVEEVVANHPAYFRSALPTLLGFGGDQQLLVAGDVGRGRLVALADPSVLINNMLRFRGNLRLVTNLLRYVGRPGRDRIVMLSGDAAISGELAAAGEPARRGPGSRINALLERVNDFALTADGMRALGFGCAVLTVCGIVLLLPWPRRDFDGHWVRPGALPAPPHPGDATWAAAVLREELEERLTTLIDAPGPVSALHPRWIVDRVRERAGEQAAAVCSRLLSSLRQVPYTSPTGALLGRGRVTHRELAVIYEQAAELLRALGMQDLQPLRASRRRATREERMR